MNWRINEKVSFFINGLTITGFVPTYAENSGDTNTIIDCTFT